MKARDILLQEAEDFIKTCYAEIGKTEREIRDRLLDIRKEIELDGTYEHTFEELEHGAKMAWRNSNRCIGRLFWDSMVVRDQRHLEHPEDIYVSLLNHIESATNGGKIIPTISVFKPSTPERKGIRILNHQLIRYAGYETESGVIGDPASVPFTKICQEMGWSGEETHFDVLPLLIQSDDHDPVLFTIPDKLILEVPLNHPDYPAFGDLGLRWYAVPIIADMVLVIGGIHYTAAPFNGWYMATEIGARNFADENRYNALPRIAELMGLTTASETTLWRDRALVEMNISVLYSYKQAGVSMVDHHTAAAQFKLFEQRESECGRPLTGYWNWLIPPVSPATTHIFHQSYENRVVFPNFLKRSEVQEFEGVINVDRPLP